MKRFSNLLVGIDIDVEGRLTAGSKPAVEQALRLAANHSARVLFAHVIDLPEAVRSVQSLQPQSAASRRQHQVTELLQELADSARAQGVDADGQLLYGKDWEALIQAVQQDAHDLVLVGTRARSVAGRALFGSTGNRLLRYCPCPVWCVKGSTGAALRTVLVAHDLDSSGRAALATGAALAAQYQAQLHVLHALELSEDRQFLGTIGAGELQLREQAAREALRRELAQLDSSIQAEIRIGTGNAHALVLDYLQRHPVDLLCMGTIARGGLAGLLTGNTAENVLPWVDCSLITVKPEGFVSPVALTDTNPQATRRNGRTA